MAQASIANYFSNRKRAATDDSKISRARKVLILDQNDSKSILRSLTDVCDDRTTKNDVLNNNSKSEMRIKISSVLEANKAASSPAPTARKKATVTPRARKAKTLPKHGTIEQFLNMSKNAVSETVASSEASASTKCQKSEELQQVLRPSTPINDTNLIAELNAVSTERAKEIVYPSTPTKCMKMDEISVIDKEITKEVPRPTKPTKITSAMDKVKAIGSEPSLNELKQKLSRSSRLAELRASLARFKQSDKQLEVAEKKTEQTKESLTLKSFKAIELEVHLSPQKPQSPQKAYLSPRKDTSICRRNLFNVASPTKNAAPMPASPSKKQLLGPIRESLTLPYKYRCLAEIFRAIDTVCQIMFNRKETVTFKKLKPAVEEMLKRNISEKHLAQICFLYPKAFNFQQEKLREFGTGTRHERWELVVTPQVEQQAMTSEHLLNRRRTLFKILIEKVKDYHQEFLGTLSPPMEISRDNITRWHPQFDIEQVPDIELAVLPRPPNEETFTTGSQVLEKARALFNCNTRMERALEKLKQSHEAVETPKVVEPVSVLKGIPKALLEKVRQRQAAKALESMTRSTAKDLEAQLYSRLPEIARLTRNLFVAEKKNVLPFDLVLDKMCHSYRAFANKNQMEEYLRIIAKEQGEWLRFEEVRGTVFLKLAKNHDLSLVMNKLQGLADQKAI